jgi:hypothetical protein
MAEYVGFNGQPMLASLYTTLLVKNTKGGLIFSAKLLVFSINSVPFDMLLGADDCQRFEIIWRLILPCLGLSGPKLSPSTRFYVRPTDKHLLTIAKSTEGMSRENDPTRPCRGRA